MSAQRFDVIVIGAGIVGLATALEASLRFPRLRIAVLDKEDRVAAHQTGHNSGVIHSGLYYRPGSLKARLCIEGARALVAFCREHGIAHEICGKLVVATREDELTRLEELRRRGEANSVAGIATVGPERIREIEPHAAGIRALHVRSTGIVDYSAVTRKYAEVFEAAGGEIVLSAEVLGIRRDGETTIETRAGAFTAKTMINCAGLYSDRIARMAGVDPGVQIVPFRGEYYTIARERRELVRNLIYPVPDPALPFLGVHFTRRIDGSIEAGPNAVLALRREGYRKSDFKAGELASTLAFSGFWKMAKRFWRSGLDEYYRSFSKAMFTRSLQKLVPEVREGDLAPGGSGVRAQAVNRDGKLVDDFHIVRCEGMVHVLNVPSPAATASLAIAREIVSATVSCGTTAM